MKLKIGDRVQTTNEHNELYGFSFEGIIDDIQLGTVVVYGNVNAGLGKSDDKYLRDLHIQELKLYDEWFEEVCGTCMKVKLVHNDMRDTLGDPGFICEECEAIISTYENNFERDSEKVLSFEDMETLYRLNRY